VALTNVPAIRGLTPLVAKWGGEALTMGESRIAALEMKAGEGGAEREQDGVNPGLAQELKARLGLEPEAPASALLRKSVELIQELAHNLGLPGEANVSQIKGGVEALKAGEKRLEPLQAEVEALKAQLLEMTATRTVEEAMMAGKISPAQKDWALTYCRRDPESFKTYVDKAPRVVPVGERLNLGEDKGRRHQGLTPEELAVCRAMNLSPEAYSQAKGRMAQAKKGGGDTKWQH